MSVHLDHCEEADIIEMSLDVGIQSVLADGSKFSYEENLAFTRDMTRLAHAKGATVEAEIGRISGTEDGMTVAEKEAKMTDPDQAREFVGPQRRWIFWRLPSAMCTVSTTANPDWILTAWPGCVSRFRFPWCSMVLRVYRL